MQQEITLIPVEEERQEITLTPVQEERKPIDKYMGLVNRMLGGFYGAAGGTFGTLSKAADWIHEKTGLPKGDAFKMLSEEYQARSQRLGKRGYQGMPGQVAAGIGAAGWEVPNIMAMGEWGLPIHGALTGAAEEGLPGALKGATVGALTHKILGGINLLPSATRLPAFAGFGFATTPGDIKERTVGALTWTALGISGGKGKVTVNEFLQAYPKLRGGINNAKAIHILKKINPEITAREIRESGGGINTLEAVVDRLTKETELPSPEEQVRLAVERGEVEQLEPGIATGELDINEAIAMNKKMAKEIPLRPYQEPRGAPQIKTEPELADMAQQQMHRRGGTIFTQPTLEPSKPPPRIIKEYPERYIEEQNRLIMEEKLREAEKEPSPEIEWPEGEVEAGGVAYGMTLEQGIPGIRIDKLDAPYKIKKVLSDLTDRFATQLKPKTRTWKTVNKQAKNILKDLDVNDFLKSRTKKTYTDAQVQARRMLLAGMYETVSKASEAYQADPSSDNLAKLMAEMDRTAMGMKVMKGIATEQARALAIFRAQAKPGEPRILNIEKILKAFGGRQMSEEVARRFAMLDKTNPQEVLSFIRNNADVKFKNKIFEAWVNALLSGPVTHLVNITSNTITLFGKPLETGLAALAEAPKGKGKKIFFGEVPHTIFGMFAGMKEGGRRALNAWKYEVTEEGISKLEIPKPAAIKGIKGRIVRIPGRALIAADEFFKAVLYSSDIYGNAYKIATSEGLRGNKRNNRVAELIDKPTDSMIDAAKREGLYRTFQKDFGPHGKHVAQLRSRYWPVQYVLPFLRTPINIAKFGLERTPLNFFRIAEKARRGQLKGEQLSQDLAKAGLGSITSAAIAIGVIEGLVTGAVPVDPRERAAFYRDGKQPYSIKIGDNWYGYGRLEPFGTVLGIAADATLIMRDLSEGDKERIAGKIIMSVTQNLTNKTFLRGLSETMNAISDPERYGKNWIKNFAGTAVPSGLAHAARVIDPTIRDAQTTLDYVKSRIPGLSKQLPARKDIYGEDIKRRGPLLARMLSPVQISPERTDFVDEELRRLGVYPGMPSRLIGGERVEPEIYEEISESAGKKLYEKLYRLIRSRGYTALSDERKEKFIRQRISEAREEGRRPYR